MDQLLYKAARFGEIGFLETLTEAEETRYFSQLTLLNNTLLHVSAEFEQAEFFKKVCLKCNPSLIWQPNAKHDTPLHVAARSGCLEIVRFLIMEKEFCNISVNQEGRRQNVIQQQNKDGDTALNCAVRFGHKDVVECLMEKDPELSGLSSYLDESPLYLAVSNSFIGIAMLITRLSPPSFKYLGPKGLTPLHAALSPKFASTSNKSVLKMMEEIMNKRPEMLKEADNVGWTPFHYAACRRKTKALKLLLEYDMVSSAAYQLDNEGNSAFHIAAFWGAIDVMKELIRSCPDICKLTNKKGQTALHIAVLNSRIKVIKYTLTDPQLGWLLNEPDDDGNTPLHFAVLFRKKPIIDMLAKDKRVNVNAMNKEFKAPGDIFVLSYKKRGFKTLKIENLLRQSNMTRCAQHIVESVAEFLNRKPELKPHLMGKREYKDQKKKSYLKYPEIYLLVATIITTVSFSAAFTMPGGYIADGNEKGKPTLSNKPGFKAFVIFDIVAFCFSLGAVYIQHATARSDRMRVRYQRLQTGFLGVSMTGLAFAFSSGLYVTLDNSSLFLSIIAYVMLCCLLLILGAIWCIDPFGGRKFIQKRWRIGKYRIRLFRSEGGRLLPVCACSIQK